jgi:hypothetical protein
MVVDHARAQRYELHMDRAAWIDTFVMHMSKLGSRASPKVLTEMAEAWWHTHENADPVKTASGASIRWACFTTSERKA